MEENLTFGSVCSGIEASQLAFSSYSFKQVWSSEIADFPNKVLKNHFPNIPNLGNMINIPELIKKREYSAPDLFCGGTPCQAFSLAGWKNGLTDDRGMLTMKFIEIANAIDEIRLEDNKKRSIILWENVEGVLNDKTNAFGNFLAGLAGLDEEIKTKKWTKSGFIKGPERNIAWRVIDAKYFGLPQQRKRLYVLAGDKEFRPDHILFEFSKKDILKELKQKEKKQSSKNVDLFSTEVSDNVIENIFYKSNTKFQVFREYTDCLYSAYGTKWNGNAAAYNGSLYVAENDRLRRFTPLECERLMGFPDNFTKVNGNSHTNRFQAVGNSWAVPVVKWIGKRIKDYIQDDKKENINWEKYINPNKKDSTFSFHLLKDVIHLDYNLYLNTSKAPDEPNFGDLKDIVEPNHAPEKFYLSAKACAGILRRKVERNMKMNEELEKILSKTSQNLKTKDTSNLLKQPVANNGYHK